MFFRVESTLWDATRAQSKHILYYRKRGKQGASTTVSATTPTNYRHPARFMQTRKHAISREITLSETG